MPNSKDEVQRQRLAQAILVSCARRHGGTEVLAKHLGVDLYQVLGWMSGKSVPPVEIVQKAIEPFIKAPLS